MGMINEAIKFASSRHIGQTRRFNLQPYITHPREVALILLSILPETDSEIIAAAVLHDVVEDTYENPKEGFREVELKFGKRVCELVEELTTNILEKKMLGKKKYLSQKMNNMSPDALLIKLADRYHNVEGLLDPEVDTDFIKWYWTETVFIIDNLRSELTNSHELLIGNINELLEYIKTEVLDKVE